jgi:hypothetical protein
MLMKRPKGFKKYLLILAVVLLVIVARKMNTPTSLPHQNQPTRPSPVISDHEPLVESVDKKDNPTHQRAPSLDSIEEFRKYTNQALQNLPRQENIQDLSAADTHHMPSLIIKQSRSLAVIADLLEEKPDLEEEGRRFYEKCALTDEIIATVRGQCLANYRSLATKHGVAVNMAAFPEDVTKLSEFIP